MLLSIWSSGYCFTQTIPNAALSGALDSMFAGVFENDGPGGSVLIQRGETVLYKKSFGFADLGTHERFSEKTVSNLGSMISKHTIVR